MRRVSSPRWGAWESYASDLLSGWLLERVVLPRWRSVSLAVLALVACLSMSPVQRWLVATLLAAHTVAEQIWRLRRMRKLNAVFVDPLAEPSDLDGFLEGPEHDPSAPTLGLRLVPAPASGPGEAK